MEHATLGTASSSRLYMGKCNGINLFGTWTHDVRSVSKWVCTCKVTMCAVVTSSGPTSESARHVFAIHVFTHDFLKNSLLHFLVKVVS